MDFNQALYQTLMQLLVFIPFYIYRLIIILIVKAFNFGNIYRPLNPFCSLLVDDFTKNPHNLTLQSILQLDPESQINLQDIQEIFRINVLLRKTKSTNQLRYPELRQYQYKFCGVWFWRPDKNFQVTHHIFEDSFPLSTNSDINKIHQHFIYQTFHPNRSPWTLALIRAPKHTSLILRMHHSLADAKSINKFLGECLSNKSKLKVAEPLKIQRNIFGTILHKLSYPLDLVKTNLIINKFCGQLKNHPWEATDNLKINARSHIAISKKISMQEIKQIAKQTGVRGSSVIYTIIGTALAKFNQDLMMTSVNNGFSVGITLPKPGHPETLINHLNGAILQIPTSPKLTYLEKLKYWNDQYNNVNCSNIPSCGLLHLNQLATILSGGGIWGSLRYHSSGGVFFLPVVITNIAFDEEGFKFGDNWDVLDFTFSAGINCSIIGNR